VTLLVAAALIRASERKAPAGETQESDAHAG
jgi:hypothetical protein